MAGFAVIQERAFAAALKSMTDEELFRLMAKLEMRSQGSGRSSLTDETFVKIVLTESAIERRFPGQMLRPYKEWQARLRRQEAHQWAAARARGGRAISGEAGPETPGRS